MHLMGPIIGGYCCICILFDNTVPHYLKYSIFILHNKSPSSQKKNIYIYIDTYILDFVNSLIILII